MLEPEPNEAIRSRPYSEQPYWHVERARIGDTHTVPVEVVVNGYAVAETTIVADGVVHTPRPPPPRPLLRTRVASAPPYGCHHSKQK